jgi:hypothetical protein
MILLIVFYSETIALKIMVVHQLPLEMIGNEDHTARSQESLPWGADVIKRRLLETALSEDHSAKHAQAIVTNTLTHQQHLSL